MDYKQRIETELQSERDNLESLNKYVWNESEEAYANWKKAVEISEAKITLLEKLLSGEI